MRPIEEFDELLYILMPWAGGYAIVLQAFFDASTRETDTFCIAGLAYGKDRAKKAERAWRSLMGETTAHLTDMHARRDAFSGISDKEADRLMRGQVGIINRCASFGVAFSCSLKEITSLLPTTSAYGSEPILNGFRTAYATLCHVAMHTLGRLAAKPDGEPTIAYLFEAGDCGASESKQFIAHALSFKEMRGVYGCRSHGFLEKRDARLLETADVLAWEWAKHVDRTHEGKGMRGSLRAMLGTDLNELGYASPRFWTLHMTGPRLERFCRKVDGLLHATTAPEIDAIAASCGDDSSDLREAQT